MKFIHTIIPLITLLMLSSSILDASERYSFRKYTHVKSFYKDIIDKVVVISLKDNLPPAAILAIAGLESGYGSGYVSQITGNILSLGAYKSDNELPALYLPYSKEKKTVLFDPSTIQKSPKGDLVYKKRPKSLKRDYRPSPYAGTSRNLELLKYNKTLRDNAHKACIDDFAKRWISKNSNIKVFKAAREWIDALVQQHGKEILFNMKINEAFIDKIGGVKNSFNYRESWPKKAKLIMHKVGLVQLVSDIYENKLTFEEAWSKHD